MSIGSLLPVVEEEAFEPEIDKPELEEINIQKNPRLSHTQVSMFLRCPRQYMLRYLEGIKLPPAGAMIAGSVYHKALEFGYKVKLSTSNEPSVDLTKEVASQAWTDKLNEESEIDWGGNPGAIKDMAVALVEKYVTEEMPKITPAKVEDRDTVIVKNVEFMRVKDLVTTDGLTIDHKLSKKAYNEANKGSDLQSLAYLYPNGGKFFYHVAVKTKVPKIQVVDFSRTQDEVDWWADMVESIARAIMSGRFPPNPTGWYCSPSWCGYYGICRGKNRRVFQR